MVKRRRRRRHPCAANKAGFSPPAPNGSPLSLQSKTGITSTLKSRSPRTDPEGEVGGGGACTPATRVSVSGRACVSSAPRTRV